MTELKRAKKASNEEVDAFLKGTDPQEHIIKIECGYDDSKATVIWRDENFKKHYSLEDFYPFCWAKQEAGRLMFGGNKVLLLQMKTVKSLNVWQTDTVYCFMQQKQCLIKNLVDSLIKLVFL